MKKSLVYVIGMPTPIHPKEFGVLGEPIIQGLVMVFWASLVITMLAISNRPLENPAVRYEFSGCYAPSARMVKILMEGLIPVSEAARTFMQKHYGGREFYIGLDSAILIGHPAAISSSLILVPLAILLSVILPGNRVILFADLAIIPFVVAMCAPLMKGNVVRIIIAGLLTLGVGFYIGTGMADLFTNAAVAAKFALPENAVKITSIGDGFMWTPFVFTNLVSGLVSSTGHSTGRCCRPVLFFARIPRAGKKCWSSCRGIKLFTEYIFRLKY